MATKPATARGPRLRVGQTPPTAVGKACRTPWVPRTHRAAGGTRSARRLPCEPLCPGGPRRRMKMGLFSKDRSRRPRHVAGDYSQAARGCGIIYVYTDAPKSPAILTHVHTHPFHAISCR